MIDIDKHLYDTNSLTVKLSVILVDLRLISKTFASGWHAIKMLP